MLTKRHLRARVHTSMSEFERIGLHGALETALLQCTMEPDSAYVRGSVVCGRGQGHLQRRVRPPGVRGKWELGIGTLRLTKPPLTHGHATGTVQLYGTGYTAAVQYPVFGHIAHDARQTL